MTMGSRITLGRSKGHNPTARLGWMVWTTLVYFILLHWERSIYTVAAGWLDLTYYYATAFKTGSYPSIEKDKIFMWSRTHPTHATAPDPVGQPTNFELVSHSRLSCRQPADSFN